jgi:putative MFS transporter
LEPSVTQVHVEPKKTNLLEMFTPEYRARTALVWMQSFTAFFVVNAFTSYLPKLYSSVGGLSVSTALLLTSVFGFIELGVRIVMAMSWDTTGRLPWFKYGFAAAVVGCFATWAAFDIFHYTSWIILATFGVMGTVGCNISVGGVYVYHPELFPTRMRSWATSTGRAVRSFASVIAPFIIAQILSAKLGWGPVFLMFGIVALTGLITIMWLGVETKQTTLEKISH